MNDKKKKLPWWVYLLQLLPATIDSIRLLVKEAKEKKKLKRDSETKQSAEKTAIDSTTTATDEKPMD